MDTRLSIRIPAAHHAALAAAAEQHGSTPSGIVREIISAHLNQQSNNQSIQLLIKESEARIIKSLKAELTRFEN